VGTISSLRRAGVLALAVLAAGCAPRGHSSAISADSHAPGTTLAKVAAGCAAYPPGAPGVIRADCAGRARVDLTLGARAYPLQGGHCSSGAGGFRLDLGVVAGPDLAGPKPDQFTLSTPVATGAFTDAKVTMTIDGKTYRIRPASGEITPAGGTLTGVAPGLGVVRGAFSC